MPDEASPRVQEVGRQHPETPPRPPAPPHGAVPVEVEVSEQRPLTDPRRPRLILKGARRQQHRLQSTAAHRDAAYKVQLRNRDAAYKVQRRVATRPTKYSCTSRRGLQSTAAWRDAAYKVQLRVAKRPTKYSCAPRRGTKYSCEGSRPGLSANRQL